MIRTTTSRLISGLTDGRFILKTAFGNAAKSSGSVLESVWVKFRRNQIGEPRSSWKSPQNPAVSDNDHVERPFLGLLGEAINARFLKPTPRAEENALR